jgi:hypothetical protein
MRRRFKFSGAVLGAGTHADGNRFGDRNCQMVVPGYSGGELEGCGFLDRGSRALVRCQF